MQQGRYAAKLIHNRIVGAPPPSPFNYFDKGSMAVVGRGFAVLQSGKVRISGFVAWFVWAVVHLQFLATSSLRLSVFRQWKWTSLTGQRGNRLIINQRSSEVMTPGLDTPFNATFAARQNSGPGRTEGVKTPTGEAIALKEAI
jgi:NADH:ubiquinone reductase (H+-translocating)